MAAWFWALGGSALAVADQADGMGRVEPGHPAVRWVEADFVGAWEGIAVRPAGGYFYRWLIDLREDRSFRALFAYTDWLRGYLSTEYQFENGQWALEAGRYLVTTVPQSATPRIEYEILYFDKESRYYRMTEQSARKLGLAEAHRYIAVRVSAADAQERFERLTPLARQGEN